MNLNTLRSKFNEAIIRMATKQKVNDTALFSC